MDVVHGKISPNEQPVERSLSGTGYRDVGPGTGFAKKQLIEPVKPFERHRMAVLALVQWRHSLKVRDRVVRWNRGLRWYRMLVFKERPLSDY